VGLRPIACWDCGFESRRSHECLSPVSVLFCQVRFLGRADHSFRGDITSVVCLSVMVKPRQSGGPNPIGGVVPWGGKKGEIEANKLMHRIPNRYSAEYDCTVCSK
jgi:hypothetical protein